MSKTSKMLLFFSGLFLILSLVFVIGQNFRPKNAPVVDKPQSSSLSFESSVTSSEEESIGASESSDASSTPSSIALSSKPKTGQLKNFTPQEFSDLSNTSDYPHVTQTANAPAITGNKAADERIQTLAQNRGYRLRPEAVTTSLQTIDGQKLQPQVVEAWKQLKAAGKKAGHNLVLVSGFRSIADQRSIFLGDLGSSYSYSQIASGAADGRIDQVLTTRSIPGFSKHHTGYTIDLGCNSTNLINFKNTPCYTWIAKDNFKVLKEAGLVPSYPQGVEKQGPNPEEWEFVWVVKEKLVE